ncbi:hypothetical protein ACI782_03855 [Geodermatophilus sp. SYSU D00703]
MEEVLAEVVGVLVTVVEACGAAVIIGAVWAFVRFVWVGLRERSAAAFVPVRLTPGRFLALGLESASLVSRPRWRRSARR